MSPIASRPKRTPMHTRDRTLYNPAMHSNESGHTPSFLYSVLGPNTLERTASALAWLAVAAAPAAGWSADFCSDPACAATRPAICAAPPPPRMPLADDERVTVSFGTSTLDPDGTLTLSDGVELRQGARSMKADEMRRDDTGRWTVPGPVELKDPSLTLRGDDAHLSEAGTAEFTGTEFEIPDRAGHGAAAKIRLDRAGAVDLTDVRYTTCPGPKPDWALKIGRLEIDAQAHTGTARHARVEVRGVPVIYTPYISFPVGDVRKSGLLFPDIGNSDPSGRQISVPWYWNIAPNYDATLTPTWYSKRGVEFGTEFRMLTRSTIAQLQVNYLHHDEAAGADGLTNDHRSYVELHAQTRLSERLRLELDGADVSDRLWLEHFGRGNQEVSVTTLPRNAVLLYRGNGWLAGARVQNHITIDPEVDWNLRPYSLLPQIAFQGYFPDQWLGLAFGLDSEYANFQVVNNRRVETSPPRETDAALRDEGQRLHLAPEIRWPLRVGGAYLEPAAAFLHTEYRLEKSAADRELDHTRSLPTFSLDSGLILERLSGSEAQRTQTLEPRVMYTYIPYRDQADLPEFDTTVPDFNLVQLFRTNRYVGIDRIGDVNQVAMGATTRLLDTRSGQQYLTATVGGVYRFATPQVLLADELRDSGNSSDVIGEMSLIGYKDWSANAGVQWDPDASSMERFEFGVQYRPGEGRVINAGYRFRKEILLADPGVAPAPAPAPAPLPSEPTERGDLRQVDVSAAWPIGGRFAAYGRFVYSLEDERDLERMIGLEYQDCCWGLRFVYNRTVSLDGRANGSWQLQIELKGLASVGNRVDAFLERSIRGYSAPRARD